MRGDLITYLRQRYAEKESLKHEEGPVITISREYGCAAKVVAQKLSEILSQKKDKWGKTHSWKWYSKEILDESAKQLQLDPSEIAHIFNYEKRSVLEEFFSSFSHYYHSDKKILNTIGKVIREIAIQGHAIIVGRGGIAITRDIPRSLHIHLHAPLEWRAIRVSERYGCTLEQAKERCIETDKKREEFKNYFQGKGTDYTWPDLTINCMTLTVDEIVEIIVKTVELRNLL
ncbi:MAG: cytidylate kinase-like family protein [Bacteroidales bacterium]|nr:cytidylate kinase-like family protein [Bacteroidales bacterium]